MSESVNQKPAQLLLEDGTLYKGKALGQPGTTTGEICFNTGMTGYQEIITDPSYAGQILVMTNCYVGNYGVRKEDVESDGVKVNGIVCKEITTEYSREMGEGTLQDYLEQNGTVGIYDIDTRALVSHLRDHGAMNAIISSENLSKEELQEKLKAVPAMEGLELTSQVSTNEIYELGDSGSKIKVAVLDLGTKRNIMNRLTDRGVFLKVFPAHTTFTEMEKSEPDGYFLTSGPGDPASMDYAVKTVQEILDSGKPLFGIGLGHQVLALANGAKTFKMHHGHRGFNHPVRNTETNKSEITSQNHGFDINPEDVKSGEVLEITHVNVNDESVEGFRVMGKNAFSVQYDPDAHDSNYLFDEFVKMLGESGKK